MKEKSRTASMAIITLLVFGACGGEPTEEEAELARHPSKAACLGYAKVARALTSPQTTYAEAKKKLEPAVEAIPDGEDITEAHEKILAFDGFLTTRNRKEVNRIVPEVEGACIRAAEKEGWEHDEY